MKKFITFISLIIVFNSCSENKRHTIRKQIKTWTLHAEANAVLCGDTTITSEKKGDIYVIAVKEPDAPNLPRTVLNYKKLESAGFFGFLVPVGNVSVFGFMDLNGNKKIDKGEPAGTYKNGSPVFLDNGRIVLKVDIELDSETTLPEKYKNLSIYKDVRSDYIFNKQLPGTVTGIDYYYFDPGFGALGMWRPLELASLTGSNIYFLEEYDSDKIPILFVHGIAGTPYDWKYFCQKIDRTKYQIWVFQYPSGFRLDGIVAALDYDINYLKSKYKFDSMILVAHSMGGLISRTFIQRFHNQKEKSLIKKYVSISSPYGGHDLAAYGVRKETKSFVPVWIDMVPGSDFQKRMQETSLNVPFYLFYGNRTREGTAGENDGTVSVKSMLNEKIVQDASEVFQFNEDHTSILNSDVVLKKLMEVLENAVDIVP